MVESQANLGLRGVLGLGKIAKVGFHGPTVHANSGTHPRKAEEYVYPGEIRIKRRARLDGLACPLTGASTVCFIQIRLSACELLIGGAHVRLSC